MQEFLQLIALGALALVANTGVLGYQHPTTVDLGVPVGSQLPDVTLISQPKKTIEELEEQSPVPKELEHETPDKQSEMHICPCDLGFLGSNIDPELLQELMEKYVDKLIKRQEDKLRLEVEPTLTGQGTTTESTIERPQSWDEAMNMAATPSAEFQGQEYLEDYVSEPKRDGIAEMVQEGFNTFGLHQMLEHAADAINDREQAMEDIRADIIKLVNRVGGLVDTYIHESSKKAKQPEIPPKAANVEELPSAETLDEQPEPDDAILETSEEESNEVPSKHETQPQFSEVLSHFFPSRHFAFQITPIMRIQGNMGFSSDSGSDDLKVPESSHEEEVDFGFHIPYMTRVARAAGHEDNKEIPYGKTLPADPITLTTRAPIQKDQGKEGSIILGALKSPQQQPRAPKVEVPKNNGQATGTKPNPPTAPTATTAANEKTVPQEMANDAPVSNTNCGGGDNKCGCTHHSHMALEMEEYDAEFIEETEHILWLLQGPLFYIDIVVLVVMVTGCSILLIILGVAIGRRIRDKIKNRQKANRAQGDGYECGIMNRFFG